MTRTTGGTSTTSTYQGASELLAKTVAGTTTSLYASTAAGAPLAQKVGSVTSFGLRDPWRRRGARLDLGR